MSDKKLQVVPLGGLGEFGMNCLALRYGDDIIVIDAGMMFPDAELMGVDIVTPDFTYLEDNKEFVRALLLTHGHEVEIGPFKVEFIHVTHSIVSAVALAITTPLGVVIHTGDFKVDPTPTDNILFDLHTLASYGKRGVLLLLSDSTNVDRPGYTPSERAVMPRFEEIFNRAEHRIIVSCFSSSIHRLQQILDISAE